MTPIAPHITAFIRERLICENTRAAYAYTFQLLFSFANKRLGVAPSNLQIEQIDAPFVLAFLDHIQQERGNCARSRNTRLAAIRSFMHFIEYRVPSALDSIRRVLAIPAQRTDTRLVKHLSLTESRAVLDAPDPALRLGTRDRAMLYLGLTGGLRVSELVTLRLADVRFEGKYVEVRVIGKGRKERALLLWKEVGIAIRAWLAIRGNATCPELFLSATSKPMTRSGFEYVLRKHVRKAAAGCPSLIGKSVSPHTLRHTCALDTLRATGDIRKVSLWLGHANQSTTEIYLQADPTEKIEALESAIPLRLRQGTFLPQDRLIASLMANRTKPSSR
ncbi:tyrosine-type recombinase/integrase [Bdellovibrionota bacterium FG-2]